MAPSVAGGSLEMSELLGEVVGIMEETDGNCRAVK